MARTINRRAPISRSTRAEDHFQPDAQDDWSGSHADDSGAIGEEVAPDASITGSGWGAAEGQREKTRSGVSRIKIGEGETVLVKAIEEAPFTSYISRFFKLINKGFIALDKDDPLEGLGEDGRAFSAFNVIPLASDKDDSPYNEMETLKVYVLQASPTLTDEMKKVAQSKRGPINRRGTYLEISYHVKSNGFGEYKVTPISETDVSEVWEIDPLSDEDIAAIKADCFTKDEWPRRQTRSELIAAAEEIRGKMRGGGDAARRR